MAINSASDARALVLAAIERKTEESKRTATRLLEQVETAANKGLYSVTLFQSPTDKELVSQQLRHMGFTVKEYLGRDPGDYSYTIGWLEGIKNLRLDG